MKGVINLLIFVFTCAFVQAQTLVINEFSNGPSGSKEYVEFLVVDNTIIYDCNVPDPPCIDIRGWIFDDHSGYHATTSSGVGIASGAVRFNNNALWSCIPVGTLIVVYNGSDKNASIPADDLSTADGNFRIIVDLENLTYFEFTETTPGAAVCSYPATGWGADPSPTWSNVGMANADDCARIVNLAGCEVFSLCYGDCNINNLIYFAGSGGGKVFYFNDDDPEVQANWTSGDATIDQTPGFPNNASNEVYIAQFNNGGNPITPTSVSAVVNIPITCGCSNSATASASGSIAGYTYEWYDDAYTSLLQSTASATNLCAGTYNVIATSSVGCPDTAQVTITSSGVEDAGGDNIIEICGVVPVFNLFDEITGTPDAGGFWEGPSVVANGDAGTFDPSTNANGEYQYILLGSGGCPNDTAFITVNLGTPVNAGTGFVASICSNSAPFNLFDDLVSSPDINGTWEGPSLLTNAHLGTFDPANGQAGDYMYITLGSGICPNDTAFVEVNVILAPNAGTDNTHALCEEDGVIDLFTVLGGSPDLGGTWSPAMASGTGQFDPMQDAAGIYTYTIMGGGPCLSSNAEIDVTVSQTPIVVENINHVTCNGLADASVDLNITPTNGNTVIWTLPSLNTVAQEDIGPVAEGNYNYQVTTADGCTFSNAVVINQPLPINLILVVTQQSCPGACDGSITASTTNGIGTTTYSLNGGAFGLGIFSNLCDGNTNITARDDNGCQTSTNTLMGALNTTLDPTIVPIPTLCESSELITLTADIPSGTWSGLGITNSQSGTFDPQQVGTGIFNVIYTISGFCGGDDTVSINVVNDPEGTIELSDTLGCLPLSVTFSNPLANADNVNCIWSISNGDIVNSCGVANYSFTNPGCYDVDLVITNSSGCSATFSANQQICVLAAPDASFSSNATTFEEGASDFLGVPNNLFEDNYQWYFQGLPIASTPEVSYDLDGVGAGEYSICLATENAGGCSDSVCETVTFVENFSVYIPNTFTPNSDGNNDLFYPVFYASLPEEFEFMIFNRWGQLIFQSEEISAYWDGTYNGDLSPMDTYIWKINYKLVNDTGIYKQTGHVNLIR